MDMKGMNDQENQDVWEPASMEDQAEGISQDIITDPTLSWFRKQQKIQERKRREKRAKLWRRVLLPAAGLVFLGVIVLFCFRRDDRLKMRSFEELKEYELFIPDEGYFEVNDDTYETQQADEKAGLEYIDMLRRMKEKWGFQTEAFDLFQVGRSKEEYIIYSYHTEFSDSLLSYSFFDLKKGSGFTGHENELWVIGNSGYIGEEVRYRSGDGNEYTFRVVGRLKNHFLPIGSMLVDDRSLMVTEVPTGIPAYLLNPDASFLQGKTRAHLFTCFILFDEDNKEKAMEELKQYGSFSEIGNRSFHP